MVTIVVFVLYCTPLILFQALSADDLLSVDVSSFEHSSMFEMVREALLNRSTGSITVEASVGVGGDRSEFRTMNVSYYYAPISGTPLRYTRTHTHAYEVQDML